MLLGSVGHGAGMGEVVVDELVYASLSATYAVWLGILS